MYLYHYIYVCFSEGEKINHNEEEMGHLVMEALTLLLSGNSSNAS